MTVLDEDDGEDGDDVDGDGVDVDSDSKNKKKLIFKKIFVVKILLKQMC
jgi:hypothetical protein